MSGHIVSRKVYFAIFLSLMVLTAATVAAAFVNLGALNVLVALTIAVAKATLVALYFMNLRYSERLTWVMVAAGVTWLGLLIGLTLSDILTRSWIAGALG
ncbi:MAG: cytochrome C oxidase subunit IV family protein [Deltaproteobacteria bacterium]|nr:cytochrome C oxidase subunit IV family protein [Deltaproteobacteria bacterium]